MSEPERRARILLVDDDLPNRVLVGAYLDSSYDVVEAPDGRTALELVERMAFDLVLLDVMMPEMSGFEVCQRLKQRAEYLPVILLTALDQQGERNAGLSAGADDFLSKPVDPHELMMRVGTFVRLRQQDQRIRHQLDELSERDSVIQKQVEELRELDVIKDDLVAMMVHDLRNPLAGIVGFLGMVASDIEDQRLRSDADMALQASGRLREILDDMLHVRMLESGAVRLHRELVEAGALVEDAIKSVWGAARARGVKIAEVVDASHLCIEADSKLVRRAVENLLSNAVKYSPSGSCVRTSVSHVGNEVQIEVADRGSGIPDAMKAQLFEKFGSIEAARGESRQGVGLGLYLVKMVASAHGGHTGVRDRKNGGAAFGLFLPETKLHC
jgi:two-component system, sensor histidine kinase and response regulator